MTPSDLARAVRDSGVVFALTHNYTGYPLVRQAREIVAAGEIGAVRTVQVEYAQDWLTTKLEDTGHKQAEWRTDPARSGAAGSVGDIGTHAFNLAEFVSGLEVEELAAELSRFVRGRPLDDNAQMLLRLSGGARGGLWCSQVAPGCENALRLRIYCERAGLEWAQEQPNVLTLTPHGEPPRLIRRAGAGATPVAAHASRIPAGHPEGYLEAFAQLYRDIAEQIEAHKSGARLMPPACWCPASRRACAECASLPPRSNRAAPAPPGTRSDARMDDFLAGIEPVRFEGPDSTNPLAFRYYDPARVVIGRTMAEYFRFAVAYWHNFTWPGGHVRRPAPSSVPGVGETVRGAKRKADVAFEFIDKLGVPFFCFHDADVDPEGKTLAESRTQPRRDRRRLRAKMQTDRRQAAVGHRQPVQPSALHGGRRDQSRSGRVRLCRRRR